MIEPAEKSATPSPDAPSIGRRLLAMVYEALLLIALLMFAGFIFQLFRNPAAPGAKHFFQLYLFLVLGGYFTWFWTHGGQTVSMKTWRIRVEAIDGTPLRFPRATLRYGLAWVSLLAAGLGYLWALADRDGQFLHDRLARTRLVKY
jgi:uncharacterized RDD family membrane protein YckC